MCVCVSMCAVHEQQLVRYTLMSQHTPVFVRARSKRIMSVTTELRDKGLTQSTCKHTHTHTRTHTHTYTASLVFFHTLQLHLPTRTPELSKGQVLTLQTGLTALPHTRPSFHNWYDQCAGAGISHTLTHTHTPEHTPEHTPDRKSVV